MSIRGERWLAIAFLLLLPFVTPKLRGADEIEYFSYLPSLVMDQDLDFSNEYLHFYSRDPKGLQGFKETFLDRREPVTGRPINFAPIGSALLWSPFYLLAHVAVVIAARSGLPVVADGVSWPYLAAVCFASAFYGFLGLRLMARLLVHHFDVEERTALFATFALWFGSPLLYYMTVAPGFSHATSLFAVALLLTRFLEESERTMKGLRLERWAEIGFLGGLAGSVREQDGFFLLLPGLWLLGEAVRRRAPLLLLARTAVMAGAAFVALIPQLLAYHALNGRFGPTTLVARKMDWSGPHVWDVLFDPGHGLFAWTPLLLLAVLGLVARLAAKREAATALFVVGFAVQTWLSGSVQSWTMAGAFGSRRFLSLLPVFALGLAFVLSALRRRTPALAAIVVALAIWWNVSLMVQFGLKIMDRQKLQWPDVAVKQVTEVPPRLFEVVQRYLTDREALVRGTR
ncbi:MAG: hypothetical protein NDJ94_01895 [Vicinamibacteria bacterium]|nr:hypothetical protein [Vicinamibacteria bacterium]